jgi:hypothetical protein
MTAISRQLIALLVLWCASTSVTRAASPAFAVHNEDGRWSLVSPDGRPFFSLGVCVFTQGTGKEQFDRENPGYAAWQHYPTPLAWADDSLRRVKSWGFTTVGGWADFKTLRGSKEQTLALTPVLHIGSTAGAPWWDMWDAKNIARMEEVARGEILALRDDPRVIGYYSDNELGWWNATLWKMTLEQVPSSGQRKRLIRLLRETYANDWNALLKDFTAEKAESWRQLERGGMVFVKPGGDGVRVMRRFLGLLADRYYALMRQTIRKFDARGLYLGDRYQSFYYPEVAEAAARHVDVVSCNLNAAWNDGTFPRFQLDTLHALTKKPILVSEFYVAARENRSGNRNDHGVYPVVATQAERAVAARTTLEGLARLPYVVGADWFQFFDEPKHGREDGENFNFGLVDIRNQPYAELTAMFAAFDAKQIRASARPRANATMGVPPAPADPFAEFAPTRALKHWDRERGFVPAATAAPLADLYVAWRTNAVCLGLYALDIVEDAYYRGASVPKQDRALWTVQVNGGETIRARLGAGREALVNSERVRLESISGLNLNVRNVAALEVPVELFGKAALKSGDEIDLAVSLVTHGRAYTMEWRGRFTLRE